ncbi:MAG: hypothetical protein ETSY1_12420 [Candidatus Entotheonella factor]|uniref:Putative zinc-finger domain-containing protein n=1 Tax=Entotheonella factor TaxID=1429438 RepID=W4LQ72_ENTF1|nr:MAG: hypothetical protein ETSY1_12420 [Candidatus Entotheonella factor]
MMCDQPKAQLYLYLDGELAAPEAAEIEQHLRICTICESEVTAHYRLQSLLQETFSDEPGADALWGSIEQQLPIEPAEQTEYRSLGLPRRTLWRGSLAVVMLLSLALGLQFWLSPAVPDVVREIVDSQIRAQLMHAPYEQVPQDANAVRRWFDGQVEFAPPVPAMPKSGFNLIGVRLNYFLNRRVAEIAYAADQHVVSFLTFADKDISLKMMQPIRLGNRTFHVKSYKGYNTVLWQDGEIFCSLVSALKLSKLLQIAGQTTGSLPAS